MEKDQKENVIGTKKGVVVSDKTDKTIIVEVTTLLSHKKYIKKYKHTKRYHVHDQDNAHHVGDNVIFRQSRPFSKNKKWVVVG